MDNLFRKEFDYTLGVFGDPNLGFFYVDYKDAVRNTYGEITGGTVYLIKQCGMRGKVITDELELKTVTDSTTGAVGFLDIDNPCVFKCSVTDLTKGGVLDALGNYEYYDNPATTVVEGILNHKYVMWHNEIYEILGVQKGIVYQGDMSGFYIITTKDVDREALYGKATLKVVTDTPPETTVYSVVVDGVLLGNYRPGVTVTLQTPSKPGYEFNGWTSGNVTITGNTFVMPETNVVVTSLWTPVVAPTPTYTVTVDGSVIGAYEEGAVVTLTVPSKEGYTFRGWESDQVAITNNTFTMPGSNVIITSMWYETPAGDEFTVTIINPAATPSTVVKQLVEGDSVVLDTGVYVNHDFKQWTITPQNGTLVQSDITPSKYTFTPTMSCTVEAVWEVKADERHTVTFVGIDRPAEKYLPGARVSLDAGIKEGYVFSRWTTSPAVTLTGGNGRYASFTMPDFDVTVTALWANATVSVVFYTEDGRVWDSFEVDYGDTCPDPGNPAKEGYTFKGWYSGDTKWVSDMTFTEDYEFRPMFEEVSVGGSEVDMIDLNSDYTGYFMKYQVEYENGGAFSRLLLTSNQNAGKWVEQHFYTGSWGTGVPPKDFTTTFGTKEWPTVRPVTTPQTADNVGQQTVLSLYSRRAPGTGLAGNLGNPTGQAVSSDVRLFTWAADTSCEYTRWTGYTARLLNLLCVTDIGGGWYRYEFGFLPGVTNTPMGAIYDNWPYKGTTEFNFPLE